MTLWDLSISTWSSKMMISFQDVSTLQEINVFVSQCAWLCTDAIDCWDSCEVSTQWDKAFDEARTVARYGNWQEYSVNDWEAPKLFNIAMNSRETARVIVERDGALFRILDLGWRHTAKALWKKEVGLETQSWCYHWCYFNCYLILFLSIFQTSCAQVISFTAVGALFSSSWRPVSVSTGQCHRARYSLVWGGGPKAKQEVEETSKGSVCFVYIGQNHGPNWSKKTYIIIYPNGTVYILLQNRFLNCAELLEHHFLNIICSLDAPLLIIFGPRLVHNTGVVRCWKAGRSLLTTCRFGHGPWWLKDQKNHDGRNGRIDGRWHYCSKKMQKVLLLQWFFCRWHVADPSSRNWSPAFADRLL